MSFISRRFAHQLFLLVAGLFAGGIVGCVGSRPVPPALLAQVRRGTEDIVFRSAVRVPLVGTPTVPLVGVMVNGHGPFRFLLDAGGSVVTLKQSVVRAAGVRVLQHRETTDVVLADSLRLGGVLFRNVAAGALEQLDVDGVLGFNLFRQGLLTLDYPAQQLTWEPGALPAPDNQEILVYQLRERMPYLPVRVEQDTVWFNFDTGASRGIYLPDSLKVRLLAPPTTGPALWNQQKGTLRTRTGHLASDLRIGPVTLAQPLVLFNPSPDALLGSGFLRHFVVTFDLARQRVRLVRTGTGPLLTPEASGSETPGK